ncbi:MAG: hypothetical protein NTY46_16400 [Candidatus Sumerlaeota bacterium]|nr:hypothetical protein [Candidatus Sumerlaeota bacterium]
MGLPKLKYFIQCDEVRNEGGKCSAIGIFDVIYTVVFPATHRRFFILMGFAGTEDEAGGESAHAEIQVQFTAPNGNVIATATGKLVMPHTGQTTNVVFAFENFPIPMRGIYTITVFLDGDFYCEHTFRVQPPFPHREHTREDIAILLNQTDIIKSANVDVKCDRCGAVYRFQHHLDPNAQSEQGFLRLPPGEFFVCAVCGRELRIAQVRENMENIVGIPRQWLEAIPPAQQPPQPPEPPQAE